MSRKSKLTVALVIFLLLLIGGMACLAAIYLSLPTYLEKELLPQTARKAGIKDFSVDVRHVGFFRADLSRIRIGPENSPLFQIQSVQLNYTPQALYRKRVKKAVLRGIEVSISFKDGNPEIHGLPLPVAKQPTSIPAKSARLDLPEIPAESIELRDVLLKPHQVQKFDQRQQTGKRTQSFAADAVGRGSRDFTRLGSPARKPFVYSRFCVMMLSSFNHLGYLLFNELFLVNPIIIGNPGGFLLYSPVSVQN